MFPKDFLFGVSMSGFQFEMGKGNDIDPNTDWFVWVRDFGNLVNGVVSGDLPENGAAYWDQYEQVHQLAVDFKMNVIRIGIEWSRIFPRSTKEIPLDSENYLQKLDEIANKDAVEHYRKIMEDMKKKGLKVFVNLNHFTLPLWLHDPIGVHKGLEKEKIGWVNDSIVEEFGKYAEYLAWKYSDIVDMWSTMNEPHVVSQLGYFIVNAGFPPSYFEPSWYIKSLQNQAKANNLAYQKIKKHTDKPVGVIYSFTWYDTVNPDDKDIFENAMFISNWNFIDMVKDNADYIGVNYYTRAVIERLPVEMKFGEFKLDWTVVPGYGYACPEGGFSRCGRPASEFGWEFYPEGLYNLLKAISQRYNKPIIVTENGMADEKDKYRSLYIIFHMYAVEKAIEEGINILGYLHWSIIDNYEWAKGYSKRFGLAYTDLEKKTYHPRPSMYIYKEIIEKKTTKHLIGYNPYNVNL